MMSKSKEPKLGLFQGIPVICRKDYFERYEIEPLEGVIDSNRPYVCLQVYVTQHWKNSFYPINASDINELGEKLSRFMQKEVKILYYFHVIKVWHRGQVVVPHRPPSYFNSGVSEEDEKLYTF